MLNQSTISYSRASAVANRFFVGNSTRCLHKYSIAFCFIRGAVINIYEIIEM